MQVSGTPYISGSRPTSAAEISTPSVNNLPQSLQEIITRLQTLFPELVNKGDLCNLESLRPTYSPAGLEFIELCYPIDIESAKVFEWKSNCLEWLVNSKEINILDYLKILSSFKTYSFHLTENDFDAIARKLDSLICQLDYEILHDNNLSTARLYNALSTHLRSELCIVTPFPRPGIQI